MSLKARVLPAARQLRPLIPLPREYAARDVLYRAIPVKERARAGSVFHCCTWKTASQWVRLVLSDPRIYRNSGLRVDLLGECDGAAFRHGRRPARPGRLATPLYGTPAQFDQLRLPDEAYRCFFVVRDPRDLLVSWYFSNLVSHDPNPAIARRRAELEALSEEAGLISQLEGDFQVVPATLAAWIDRADRDPQVRLVHYEDLVGGDADRHWAELFEFCGMAIPDRTRAAVLRTYSFERMTGGRRQGDEDRGAKYRRGAAGDWGGHFTPALTAEFDRRHRTLVERLGYER